MKVGEKRNSMSQTTLLEYLVGWVLDRGHTRGRKKQFLNSVALHWKVKTLFGLVLTHRQVKKFNLFASLEDVKKMEISFHGGWN